MKKQKYFYLLSAIVFFLFLLIFSFRWNNNNQDLAVNIIEEVVISVDDNDSDLYIYSFIDNSISSFSWSYLRDESSVSDISYWNDNIVYDISSDNYLLNRNLYIDWKPVFKCNSYCHVYTPSNADYLVFADRVKTWTIFFKKNLGPLTFRVLNLDSLEYRDYPLLKVNWETISISKILGRFD